MRNSARGYVPSALALLLILCGTTLMVLSPRALALTTCTGNPQTITIPMPAMVTVPSDAAVGTLLSSWAMTPATPNWFTCSSTVQESIGIGFIADMLPSSGLTISDEGTTYTVFNTNLAGVGIAIGSKGYANGCGWQARWFPVGIRQGIACNSAYLLPNGGQLRAILVKTGPISAGTVNSMTVAKAPMFINEEWSTTLVNTINITSTRVTVLSCTTPDVLVKLGTHDASELAGMGSFSAAVGFDIALNNCPAGINTITYQIDAITPILNAASSVVALDNSSTASGIGVQLLDGMGNPFPFAKPTQLMSYSGTTGGNYKIPLKARYYQTESRLNPGTANTMMSFTMTYK
ncbi:fimbrial protein [Yersinia frederiksenii]|uniref:fimbrial protein n=1 Tax=Yersinia frederiksenii TaxID=29484 RepID=UPI001C98CDFF|nr:fimbrial protein [Yersinia frederiksenii]